MMSLKNVAMLVVAGIQATIAVRSFAKVMHDEYPDTIKNKNVSTAFNKVIDGQLGVMAAVELHAREHDRFGETLHAHEAFTAFEKEMRAGMDEQPVGTLQGAKSVFMTKDEHPGYPYLLRGNSGAVWRVEKNVTPANDSDYRAGAAVCVLGSEGAAVGDRDTLREQNFFSRQGGGLLQVPGRFIGAVEIHNLAPQGSLGKEGFTYRESDAK